MKEEIRLIISVPIILIFLSICISSQLSILPFSERPYLIYFKTIINIITVVFLIWRVICILKVLRKT